MVGRHDEGQRSPLDALVGHPDLLWLLRSSARPSAVEVARSTLAVTPDGSTALVIDVRDEGGRAERLLLVDGGVPAGGEPGRPATITLAELGEALARHPELAPLATEEGRRQLERLGPDRATRVPDIEARSWWLTAHLLAEVDRRLDVLETHPGGGQYDCLTLVTRATRAGDAHVHLNRAGSVHVFANPGWAWRGVWQELADGMPYPLAAQLVAHHAGLRRRRPVWGAQARAAAVLAAVLDAVPGVRVRWGIEDSSDWGGRREDLLAVVGDAATGDAAQRWWFVVPAHGSQRPPLAAVDLVAGRARPVLGQPLDLTGPGAASVLADAVRLAVALIGPAPAPTRRPAEG